MARAPGATARTTGRARDGSEIHLGNALRTNTDLHAGTMIAFDSFRGDAMLMKPIPRPGVPPFSGTWKPRPVTDIDVIHLLEWFQQENYKKVSMEKVHRAVDAEAHRNAFSSAKDWLLSLPAWDGIVRLDHFADEVCGAKEADEGDSEDEIYKSTVYLAAIGRKFFISIVARIMEPGCQVDTVVVLEGPQGAMKTTLLREIAIRPEWFSDSFPVDMKDKDAAQGLPGNLIIEMSEMGQMRGSRVDTIKGFLSRRFDKYRPSYGRRFIYQPRQCVFAGSTNAYNYLSDKTGNRRFWPLRCGAKIDIAKAKAWMPQLYAEALEAKRAGEQWHLTSDMEKIAEEIRMTREPDDLWEDAILTVIDAAEKYAEAHSEPYAWVTTKQCLLTIDPNLGKGESRSAEMRAGNILQKQGFEKRKKRDETGSIRWFYRRMVATNG